jgi:DNA polymerase-3 subunit epsilon
MAPALSFRFDCLSDGGSAHAMLNESLAIVDLETTGISALTERITEIAIVQLDDGVVTGEWQSLVNPGVPIPAAITALTGISNEMVRDSPCFSDLAQSVAERLRGRRVIAHNVRFDYAFLKAEFARAGMAWQAPTLCTVRLSRTLLPDEGPHGLDAIAQRHLLAVGNRHRAMGDAQLVLQFLEALYVRFPQAAVDAAVRHLSRRASLPSPLPADTLATLPSAPGVYVFYGDADAPLYVGKAKNIRSRVGQHFTSDHASDTDLRLSLSARRVAAFETNGEASALIREIELVHALQPAYNRALRRKAEPVAMLMQADSSKPKFVAGSAITPAVVESALGVWVSRAHARAALKWVARDARLCFRALGLERGRADGPCFAYQLGRCQGACIGEEASLSHRARVERELIAADARAWQHDGPLALVEGDAIHVFSGGFYFGEASDWPTARARLAAPPQAFDIDLYRLVANVLKARPHGCEVVRMASP